jgi:hypothetical protein
MFPRSLCHIFSFQFPVSKQNWEQKTLCKITTTRSIRVAGLDPVSFVKATGLPLKFEIRVKYKFLSGDHYVIWAVEFGVVDV